MARISNITFGQVAQIADAMKAAGARPTARAVRERIGFGSMGTVHKLLQQWAGKVGGASEDEGEAELPSHITKALMDFIGSEVATAQETLQEELQEAQEEAAALASENERLGKIIEELEQTLADERTTAATIEGKALTLAEEVASWKTQCINERHAAENTRLELAKALLQLEAVPAKDAELATLKAELSTEHEKRINAEKQAAVFEALLTKGSAAMTPVPPASEYRLEICPPDMAPAPRKAKRSRPATVKDAAQA